MSAILPVLFSLPLLYLGLRWFQRYVTDAVCTSKARLDGKTVLITGGNSGIGKETAVELAKRGARVIAADKEGGLETSQDIQRRSGNSDVQFYKFDLASLASVREFSGQILAREPRLDILINNAGVAGLPYVKTEDGFESHIGVNHLGHFLLTNLLLERLKESPSARIIVVASAWHYFGKIQFDDLHLEHSYDIQKAYAQSKLANMLFMKSLARRLRGQDVSNVTVNAVHPGYVNTGMLIPKAAMPFLLRWAVKWIVLPVVRLFLKTPWQGAQTSVHCAVSEAMEGVSGQYLADCRIAKRMIHPAVHDEEMAEKLWELSVKLVGLHSESR